MTIITTEAIGCTNLLGERLIESEQYAKKTIEHVDCEDGAFNSTVMEILK